MLFKIALYQWIIELHYYYYITMKWLQQQQQQQYLRKKKYVKIDYFRISRKT